MLSVVADGGFGGPPANDFEDELFPIGFAKPRIDFGNSGGGPIESSVRKSDVEDAEARGKLPAAGGGPKLREPIDDDPVTPNGDDPIGFGGSNCVGGFGAESSGEIGLCIESIGERGFGDEIGVEGFD